MGAVWCRLENGRFSLPIRKTRSAARVMRACEASLVRIVRSRVGLRVLAVFTLARDLAFNYCPRRSGSQKIRLFRSQGLVERQKESIARFPLAF